MKPISIVSEEKLNHYFGIAEQALAKAKPAAGHEKDAKVILDMARHYFSDARHFNDKGDKVLAFAALNYLHGWLDSGAMLGILDVGKDSRLFTVD